MKPTPEFIRELSSNYMVLCPVSGEEDSFALKMLARNHIFGLLPMEVKTINNSRYYYYDITGKKSVHECLQKQQVSFLQFQRLYEQILKLPDILKEFLLPENSILMAPEFVYTDDQMQHIEFCCYLGTNKTLQEQIRELTEYLLNKVDYKDENAVVAVYAIYQVSNDESCTLEKLRDVFNLQCQRVQSVSKKAERVKEKKSNDQEQDMDIRIKKVFPETDKKQEPLDFSHMEERMESQKEVMQYPMSVYGKAAIVLAAGFVVLFLLFWTGMLNVNGQPDMIRYAVAVLGCLVVEGVLFFLLFQKKNQCARVKDVTDYVDWEEAYDLEENSGIIYDDTVSGYYQDAFLKETGNCVSQEFKENISAKQTETFEAIDEDEEAATELLVDFQDQTVAYLESEFSGERIYITRFPFLIGKLRTGADYVLDNNKISRIHAKIDYDESCYYIEDMDSTNGTSMNGIHLQPHDRKPLSDKDKICFADKNFIFHC